MKLKAPPGAGDPCVAGVTLAPRDGLYDVEAEIGALLVECFGFVEFVASAPAKTTPAAAALRQPARSKAEAHASGMAQRAGFEKTVSGDPAQWPPQTSPFSPT